MELTKGSFMTVISRRARKLVGYRMWGNLNARINIIESSPMGNEESLKTTKEKRKKQDKTPINMRMVLSTCRQKGELI